jgi:hypothetical protein
VLRPRLQELLGWAPYGRSPDIPRPELVSYGLDPQRA